MGTGRTPWRLGRITTDPIGLVETVARVEHLTNWEMQRMMGGHHHPPLFYAVCDWRINDPGRYLTLAKLLGHRKATYVASVACARPASQRRSP